MNRIPLALLCLALAGQPALAASALEATRAGATSARNHAEQVRHRQSDLRLEMNQLAARIESLKAQQKGPLLPGSDLEASLRRSQELSGLLSAAARDLSAANAETQRENVALLTSLSQAMGDLKARWEQAGRDERRALLGTLRALRAEREQVRAQLPAAAVPALGVTTSDDPEELLEQADALRDSEDRVRQSMAQLKSRIGELKEERELDRRMSDFLGEEAIFDEQDRRLRLSHEQDSVNGDRNNSTGAASQPGTFNLAGPNPNVPGPGTNAPPPQSTTVTGTRPVVGGVAGATVDSNDLQALQAQLSELDHTAEQLEQRARQMEERARQLK